MARCSRWIIDGPGLAAQKKEWYAGFVPIRSVEVNAIIPSLRIRSQFPSPLVRFNSLLIQALSLVPAEAASQSSKKLLFALYRKRNHLCRWAGSHCFGRWTRRSVSRWRGCICWSGGSSAKDGCICCFRAVLWRPVQSQGLSWYRCARRRPHNTARCCDGRTCRSGFCSYR